MKENVEKSINNMLAEIYYCDIKTIAEDMILHANEMRTLYGRNFISRHEAISVLREEFEEAWDVVKENKNDFALHSELIQIGAMAILIANLVKKGLLK